MSGNSQFQGSEYNGIPQKKFFFKVNPVFFFFLEWFGTSFQKFFLSLNGSERNSNCFSLLRNGSEQNTEQFLSSAERGRNEITRLQSFSSLNGMERNFEHFYLPWNGLERNY